MDAEYIGLDIGSSSIKGAVLNTTSLTIGKPARCDFPTEINGLPPLYFEIDASVIVDATKNVLDELLSTTKECRGIVLCSQMQGTVLTQPDGSPLSNYISWRDQRVMQAADNNGTYYNRMLERLDDSQRVCLGGELKPGASPSLLYWLAENGGLPDAEFLPMIVGDFLLMKLAAAEPVTEFTNALGAINLETRQWAEDVFATLGIGGASWPRLVNFSEPIGHYQFEGHSIPCYPSVGDHQCALVGTLLQERELSLNISTGSQVSLLSREMKTGSYQIRPFFDQQYLNTITHLPAGRSLNVLVDFVTEFARASGVDEDPWPFITQAVDNSQSSELSADLAFFTGPMGERGNIDQISIDNLTVGNLFRAAFANMADNYSVCAQRLSSDQDWNGVVLSGGLPQRLGSLRATIAERFNCECRVSESTEETLQGLLALTLVIEGRATSVSDAIGLLREA
ncbi:MAG: hypothetical protein CMJ78_22305 [Planctomycetaceae bacterium]|nr:hypothetical protein [Planctomycetaceae bacterium]